MGVFRPSLAVIALLAFRTFAQESLPTLTSARELRALSAEQAKLAYPVHLRATVTLVESGRTTFLRDDTGATFIRGGSSPVHVGQIVEVEGKSYPGLYIPGIAATRVTVIGEALPLEARPLSYEQLASGQFHYDWVEVRGIVRAITVADGYSALKLALGNGAIEIVPVTDDASPADRFIDATVVAKGIAAGFINDRRQLVAPHLRVNSLADLTLVEPAPAEPEIAPASELLRFAPGGRAGHRVKVRGVVMHHDLGNAVYLRDEEIGLRVRTAESVTFLPGEVVEALGFPTMGTLSAELADAALRRTGETATVVPVAATAKDLLTGKYDADLVQIEGEVRDTVRETDRLTLAVQAGDAVFLAVARSAFGNAPDPGARVRLTGVCRVVEATQPTRSFNTRARTVELLLRAPASDIEVLRRPPWWTAKRLAIAASTLFAVALLAFVWAALLRRQVRRQTVLIRSQVETVAIAEERQRIAREFHDTLEQELVGVSLRLDAAATRAEESKLRELLAGTQRLVNQLQAGARSFVWNLRDSSLAGQPLASAISQAVANLTTGRQLEVRTSGEAHRLPETVAHELLRVAQEATANAVKHGGALHIIITLDFADQQVRLTVADDGKGFPPAAPVPAGHFGLLGMRERVQKLGGQFTLHSAPGKGTTVEVAVPLA